MLRLAYQIRSLAPLVRELIARRQAAPCGPPSEFFGMALAARDTAKCAAGRNATPRLQAAATLRSGPRRPAASIRPQSGPVSPRPMA